ncbi:tRNA threonylcarbamoyladenosine biosynthesis protein TsaE [Sporosarcina newyorkensis]|uniref:tRNA threonylcarbamoyladenosine biosynthesis protein TsaE n=2 Tax=Caryophanaceae TaxID=186818 RepID=A0A1T4YZN0_9BACL|nr:tRNA (adenosine(37)-N6)-threonylcarbamoyltransferase complex ATPase subunit type 1 TsaE [Sporosarcina aquimarina]SKB07267.1 tRNA threonylcarbamoyladenosine biosynthesis protein TsaE [Sporosarcina newyorkensis]
MAVWRKEIKSVEEMEKLAAEIGSYLKPPDVLTLEGDLGAGKTTFAKALAKSIGITRTVSSPTFTIIKQYEGNYPLNHLDVYRLATSDEDLGWDELFYGDAISIIEWAQFIADELPEQRLEVVIHHTGPETRTVELTAKGERFTRICEEIFI